MQGEVYPKMTTGLKDLGSPDLVVLFTSTISHKMVQCALKGNDARIARSHSSSIAALRSILNEHAV